MRVKLTNGAERDLEDAVSEYENTREGLGAEFSVAVDAGIIEIAEHPPRWPREFGDVRRFLMRRFPYKIIYQLREGELWVYAVMHTSRSPGYWHRRVTKK